ncbi:MAG: hypothetical protein ACKV19_20080 [Verrucomicrobiales bacterium]
MPRWFALILTLAAVIGTAGAPLWAQLSPGARRFIATGPDNPTPASFRRQWVEFEKLPFDGAVIRPTRQLADGTLEPADFVFSRHPWQPAEIDAMVADFKEVKPTRAREIFLAVQARPGDVDWFDDTGWRETVDHWRLLARAAKLGGLRGLAFDIAPDGEAGPLFDYAAQAKRKEKDFTAYAKVARDRGRDVMLAIASEFPEAVIFCPSLYSELVPLLSGEASPAGLLPSHRLGLLPPFLDGWWDAAPPKVQIIDGLRPASRHAVSEADFSRAYTTLRTQVARLAAPDHRTKLRAQFLIGQGVPLDSFLLTRAATPSSPTESATAPDLRLTATATAALRASDGWIWIGGHAGRWWTADSDGTQPAPWVDAIPGVATALARARTPTTAARERLATASPAENRLVNGDFTKEGREGLPESWWTWQRDDSRGTARREPPVGDANQPATATWSGATEAHFGQEIDVKAGETYVLGSLAKSTGPGTAVLKIGWKDTRGQWTAPEANVILPPDTPPDPDGWQELAALIRVPPGASQLVVMLGALGQPAPEDRIVFARAQAVRL